MSNWISNRLLIEGPNVDTVLQACGFLRRIPNAESPTSGPQFILMDVSAFDKTVAREEIVLPFNEPRLNEDIYSRTDTQIHFRFYTKWVPALNTIAVLAEQFPLHRFSLLAVDISGYAPLPMGECIPGAVLVMYGSEEMYFNDEEPLYGTDGWVVFQDRHLPERFPSLRQLEFPYTDELALELQQASVFLEQCKTTAAPEAPRPDDLGGSGETSNGGSA